MSHGLLCRHQMQLDLSFYGLCGKIKCAVCFRLHHPMIDPGQAISNIEPTFPKAAAARLIIEKEFFACRIGDGEMREFQIIHNQPGSRSRSFVRWSDSLAEKGQLVAKTSCILIR